MRAIAAERETSLFEYTKPKTVIRRCGWDDVYIKPDGSWGSYEEARKFKTADCAEQYAAKNNVADYGLFYTSSPRPKRCRSTKYRGPVGPGQTA